MQTFDTVPPAMQIWSAPMGIHTWLKRERPCHCIDDVVDSIDLQSVIGLTLIVGGGLYTFSREIKRKRPVSVQKPLR